MTESPHLSCVNTLNIFDLFSGPGEDAEGNPGSPMIIVEELKQYCATRGELKANKPIRMYFNDKESNRIELLGSRLSSILCKRNCCKAVFSSKPFSERFEECLPIMHDSHSANLVIMDQFGISDVTPEVVQRLAKCSRTDILFFIPSSHIHRFRNHPAFSRKIDLNRYNPEYNTIHRYICEHYREKLAGDDYYLAPFSIKSGSSIHGLVFGSGNLYGLQKFLTVCWKVDPKTGEANYSIDRDPSWSGEDCLFPEMNIIRKIDRFEHELKAFIFEKSPDNIDMYRFILIKGFTPAKANELLRKLHDENWLTVISLNQRRKVRKGAFYLRHDEKFAIIRFKKSTGES